MNATLVSIEQNTVTIEMKVNLTHSMLETEQIILNAVNDAGNIATTVALQQFDTDGSPLLFGQTQMYSKGKEAKKYQTPYGEIFIERHVYQGSTGGKTFCPLERDARIVTTSTPRFAQMVSNKTAQNSSPQVQRDLKENHSRHVARSFLRSVAEAVGAIAQAKEEIWHYSLPQMEDVVKTISLGLDGTCLLLCDDGYRETMVGTLSLYNRKGERMHSVYLGAPPQYGKAVFYQRMDIEIANLKKRYPQAKWVGVADGAKDNWKYLDPYISQPILDFYHVTGYLKGISEVVFPRSKMKREVWLDEKCHQLKHEEGAAQDILNEMGELLQKTEGEEKEEKIQTAITYFTNHLHQMDYLQYLSDCLPIGSGVTESACKTLIKQRLCCAGMKWKEKGAGAIISLRSLILTKERWNQFWNKINQYRFPITV